MKKPLLIALIACSSLIGTAQITVTSITFPATGNKLRYTQASNPNVAVALYTPPGGNQIWNLSILKAAKVFETAFRPATEGANVAFFPGATMVVIDGTTESYYKSSSTKLELLGQVSTTIAGINLKGIYINQPPIAVRRSPLNFFDIYQQSSSNLLIWAYNQIPAGAINLPVTPDSIRIRISNQIVEVVDAWGTLTLPGSLPQSQYPVIRLKKTTYHEQRIDAKVPPLGWLDVTDNIVRGGTPWASLFGVDTVVSHHYFNNVEKEEIAILTFNNEQNAVTSVVYKNTIASTPVVESQADPLYRLHVYPNPAVDNINISCPDAPSGIYTLKVFNILGTVIKESMHPWIENKTINIVLPINKKGLFFCRLEDSKGKILGMSRLMVTD